MNKNRTILLMGSFDIPSATPQQRKLTRNGRSYSSRGLSLARASWLAFLEKITEGREMCKGAKEVEIELYYHTKNRDLDGKPKTTRPDAVNLAKLIEDCMMEVGIIDDDSNDDIICRRRWTTGNSIVYITISGLEGD